MDQVVSNMDARQFYLMTAKMRKAQRDYEKLPSTRNKIFKSQYEEIIDNEIERVEKIKREEANNLQTKLL